MNRAPVPSKLWRSRSHSVTLPRSQDASDVVRCRYLVRYSGMGATWWCQARLRPVTTLISRGLVIDEPAYSAQWEAWSLDEAAAGSEHRP